MANSRYYSSIAQQTTLTSGITNSGTSMQVASTAGFPGSLPYTLALDYGSAAEELVQVNSVAGLTLTIVRAIDGTSGQSHNPGAVVRHVSSARDFTDSRTHEASSSGVHGVLGSVVGTTDMQTLTNKTVTLVQGSAKNFKLFNQGSIGVTQVIGDSTFPNVNRLEILDNEAALNVITLIAGNGSMKMVKGVAETDATYRIRVTDSDGSTDRFGFLSGGTLTISPTSTTGFIALDIVAPDTSTGKRAIRVAASGGGTERFTVFNDGRVDILGTSTAQSTFDVTGPAAHAAAYTRVLDGSANTLHTVGSTGRMAANACADIRNDFHTGGVGQTVLRVFGRQPGQTGDLQQWVDAANTIQAQVAFDGTFTFNKDPVFAGSTTWTAYTPTIVNGGAFVAGASTSGWYKKIGKIVMFEAYVTVGTPGTGTTNLTLSLPSTPFRDGAGAGTTRQAIFMHAGGVAAGTNTSISGSGSAVVLSGGSGAVIDRLAGPTDIVMRGEQLQAATILTVQGWYREA